MYYWRKLTEKQRAEVLEYRKGRKLPWHSPPHLDFDEMTTFIITAACFDHAAIIGKTTNRLAEFEESLLSVCSDVQAKLSAWCILPNHYHFVASTSRITELRTELGRLHGRTSRKWNLEDDKVGRKVWFNFFDRNMKSERHYWASLNYVHNNAVHHAYVDKWQEWPFSSAHQFLAETGRDEAVRIWFVLALVRTLTGGHVTYCVYLMF